MTANASAPALSGAPASVAPADSLTAIAGGLRPSPSEDLRRRLTYLMLFRVGVISLVMGSTALLYWISDVDLTSTASLMIFAIIGFTYLLTIIYAVRLTRADNLAPLGRLQLAADLVIASLLMHVTGGAQSAYTFFFPLAIIGAATIGYRRAAVIVALAGGSLFILVSVLGWLEVLPSISGQRIAPSELSSLELSRALGLNLAGIAAVAFLAVNLGGQLERTSASLVTHQTAAADLRVLHEDIIRCLSSGVMTVDLENHVLTLNEAGREILGARDSLALGANLDEIVPGLVAVLQTMAPGDSLYRTEVEIPRDNDSPLVLGLSISPLSSSVNKALGRVVSFQDLTQMRELEQSMARAERLAVIGSLAAGVAHEIRNPLASISGSIELLRAAHLPGDEDNAALMTIVTREVDRLNTLVTDLLDYANPRPLELVTLELDALVRDTLRVFEQDRDFSGIEVQLGDRSDTGVTMIGDPEKLRQVLWNLLRNAAEAATEGGGNVRVDVTRSDDMAELSVTDDGPGIPAENVHRVFDPFFTTKDRGSGLGLAVVHELVMDHGGQIRVDSRSGRGTTFAVFLPRKQIERETA